jgi:hypothetical protein
VAKLSRLRSDRAALGGPLAATPKGDFDLLPVAIILWVGSVARVAAGALEDEVFQGEATLALLSVLLIPCWALWSWIQCRKDAEDAHEPGGDDKSGIFTKS